MIYKIFEKIEDKFKEYFWENEPKTYRKCLKAQGNLKKIE